MFAEIAAFVHSNPLMAGIGGATIAGYVIANAKTLPKYIWHIFKDQFSTELLIWSEDTIFSDFDRWLANHPSTKKMRRLAIAEWWDASLRGDDFALTPGPGLHMLWRNKRPFFVHRMVDDDKKTGTDSYSRKRKQTLTITTPGRSQKPIIRLLDEIRCVHRGKNLVPIYMWNGTERMLVDRRTKRSMDTVYCAPNLKENLLADIELFLASKERYHLRGVPYRRGYLLEGPPGTGKTTMIYALASYLEKRLYIIAAGAIENDKELISAINAADDDMVVIEDIDSLRAAAPRESVATTPPITDTSKAGITLSGLLNAFDGLSAREGRMLVITTNKPEVLDAALLRDGRVDYRVHFSPAGMAEALAMFNRFQPQADPAPFMAEITPLLPMPQAELQTRLLRAA